MSKLVVYLHGFASSSVSEKALITKDYFQQHLPEVELLVPDLPYTPREAVLAIEQALQGRRPDAVIGSSLGGFLATYLAENTGCYAALINPAVAPYQLLSKHLGSYRHPVLQQDFVVEQHHMPLLEQLESKPSALDRYLVLLQQGDEVLDYRKALQFYAGCTVDVQSGGDHSYQGYANCLPAIVKFCQLE
jgi:predicted esterase YcpF (UPF0227 family)